MPGRKTLLTQEVHDRIVQVVEDGNWDCVAAEAAGVSVSAFETWKRRGVEEDQGEEDPESPYVQLVRALKSARALAEIDSVEKIRKDPSFQAQMTYLERKYPERWGRRDRVKVETEDGLKEIIAAVARHHPDAMDAVTDALDKMGKGE